MFIDKLQILFDTFITKAARSKHWKNQYSAIYKYQFEHYIMSITMYCTGPKVHYLKEDNIDMYNLPDSDEGALILYYDIDESIDMIENEVEHRNQRIY